MWKNAKCVWIFHNCNSIVTYGVKCYFDDRRTDKVKTHWMGQAVRKLISTKYGDAFGERVEDVVGI